ncbi:FAD-dependent oxidoreductase [Streptomyces sp. NBC_01408]|uniref:FAD-dependent oxidoreductase n=1 Tax=Streptomyces sp. NBC_01408 TaxID=2903855 RepID=UPI00224F5D53|nr:FAD-dependent oxidoreductase [Streptomyces sp. NBC_01408]MCX4695321.1 FAD-dependent oxidoreductase [Streptomyces sp. NBC_01408]
MTGSVRYDVIVVGGGVAGSLVARQLGERGRRVLVLEAGARTDGPGPAQGAAAPGPEVTDLTGLEGGGYRADGYFVQRGPLPYASAYLRVNGGTGTVWTGLTPRMLPEDFDTEAFGYGRSWPLSYQDLEPHYRAAEYEIGVSADVEEQRGRVGLTFPDGYVFPMRARGWFEVDMPSLNGPAGEAWSVRCRAAELTGDGGIDRREPELFSFGAPPVAAHNRPYYLA